VVPVEDAFFLTVEEVDQEEELLLILGWQWFDVLFEVNDVFYSLLLHLLLRHCLLGVLLRI
jgi:hypothetical protein